YINQGEQEAGNADFDYALMPDDEAEEAKEGLVNEKGFFILPSELFSNVCSKADTDENLNETLERIFKHIEESAMGSESEGDFAGLFDDFDVNSNKLGSTVAKRNERLAKLLHGVADMNLGSVKDHDIDAFGDAYEYLMTMYASNAGKSGGEFFTPADVSELLTRLGTVGKTRINKVYDPACGSGSLLLKAEKVLGKEAVTNGFYGQEINITTYNLCRINMFLHDIGFDKFDIACDDTLTSPQHWDDEPFELIVSNPPYSIKWAGDSNPLLINDPRYAPAGVLAPKSKADMAFIMHSLSWLAPNGTAAIVCFPGIMYRGGAEKKIRKYLVDNNFVDCIIQLPSNLFFGTSIATCIMVLKKGKSDNTTIFIDATKECIKVTNNNRLTEDNLQKIVSAFAKREEIKHFSHVASYEEIAENDYNLSVSTYVEAEDTREVINIKELNAEIEEIVLREAELRDAIRNIIEEIEGGV
ncbi:MAG: type I restriction-modification system subunit M, partial [Selenomonadaceae bacterium]|nr:type I restriction-modification system subunit M [Selenomonadaceae bacterium]